MTEAERARAAPPPLEVRPPAPLAPVHPDAGLARRGAAHRRRRRGRLPRRHARATATSTASRRSGATSTGTACRRSTTRCAPSSSGWRTRRCSGSPRPPRSSAPRSCSAGPAAGPHARVLLRRRRDRGRDRHQDGVPAPPAARRRGAHASSSRSAAAITATPSARCRVGGIDLFHRIFKPLLFDGAPRAAALLLPLPARRRTPPCCGMACADEVERIFAAREGEDRGARRSSRSMQGADGMIAQPPGLPAADARALRSRTARSSSATRWRPASGAPAPCSRSSRRASSPTSSRWRRGSPAATCRSPRPSPPSACSSPSSAPTPSRGPSSTATPTPGTRSPAPRRPRRCALFRERRVVEGLARRRSRRSPARSSPLASHPHVGEVRQRGLMVGIELVRDRATREEYAYELARRPPGCRGGAPARRDPAAARERGGAHAAARHDRGRARGAARHRARRHRPRHG